MSTTATLPSPAEVEQAARDIIGRRAHLDAEYDLKTASLEASIADVDRAEADHRHKIQIAQKVNSALATIRREIKTARVRAALKAIDGNALDLVGFDALEPLEKREQNLLRLVSDLAEFFIPEAADMLLAAKMEQAAAEAAQYDAIIGQREFERELALTAITSIEGEVVIDRNVGVTAELVRQAAQARLRAETFRADLTEMQRIRRERGI